MTIYIDLISGAATLQPRGSLVSQIPAKLGAWLTLDVVFHRAGQLEELPVDAVGVFAVKRERGYSAPVVFAIAAWTPGLTLRDGYRFSARVAGSALAALLGEEPFVSLICDVSWSAGGKTRATQQMSLMLANQIWRDDELPPEPEDPYPLPGAIVVRTEIGLPGGVAALGPDGKVPLAQIPGVTSPVYSDLSAGPAVELAIDQNHFYRMAIDAPTDFLFSGPVAPGAIVVLSLLSNTGEEVTWPAGITWAGATPPPPIPPGGMLVEFLVVSDTMIRGAWLT